jgi:hypothetical protein
MRNAFEKIPDHRRAGSVEYTLADVLMCGFALFSLKNRSLLEFKSHIQNNATGANLRSMYRIEKVPSDTQMREILDPVPTDQLRPVFKQIIQSAQRGGLLKEFQFIDGHYLASIDGTGYFASDKIHCASCQEKKDKRTGAVSYSHAMLGIALVLPGKKQVLPLCPEPIIKQDGEAKNDCERNAAKRLLERLRKDHPRLPLIIVEDGLSSNAPHIEELQRHGMSYILGVKQGDHAFLFEQVMDSVETDRMQVVSEEESDARRIERRVAYVNGLSLNRSHPDLKVNFLELYEDIDGKEQYYSWITNIEVTEKNAFQLAEGGRARWKIENETFNTLKNQGYHFEHNFGHGHVNLSVILALLMMLAFLCDQIQECTCPVFQAALARKGRKQYFWESIRAHFSILRIHSWTQMLLALLLGPRAALCDIADDTS